MSKEAQPHREDYERYGMDNEDWRHMDEYWRIMYGSDYPHENEHRRKGGFVARPKFYEDSESEKRAA